MPWSAWHGCVCVCDFRPFKNTKKQEWCSFIGGFEPSSGEFNYHHFSQNPRPINILECHKWLLYVGVPDCGKFAAHASLLLEVNQSYQRLRRQLPPVSQQWPTGIPTDPNAISKGLWKHSPRIRSNHDLIQHEKSRNQPEKNGSNAPSHGRHANFSTSLVPHSILLRILPCVRQWIANGFILQTSWHGYSGVARVQDR